MFIKRSIKVFVIAIAAFAFASVGTAFANSNTVDVSGAGDGVGDISGYVVKNVQYGLAPGDPTNISSVKFDLYDEDGATPAPSTTVVKASLTGATPYSANCAYSGPFTWTCTISSTVASATILRVVAFSAVY